MTEAERLETLHEITGVMGEALARLEKDAVTIDRRSLRLFVDAFSEAWRGNGLDPNMPKNQRK